MSRLTVAAELLAIISWGGTAAWLGARLDRRSPRWGLALVLLALLPAGYTRIGRRLPWLLGLPQHLGLPIAGELFVASCFVALGVGVRRVGHRRVGRVAICFVGVFGAFYCTRAHLDLLVNGPRYAALRGQVIDGQLLQSTPFSCAPTCAAIVLRQFGLSDADEGELAWRCRTSRWGTSAPQLARGLRQAGAARQRGLRCRFERRDPASQGALADLPSPTILFVFIAGRVGHVVVLQAPVAGQPGAFWIADPLQGGRQALDRRGLVERYGWGGLLLRAELIPTAECPGGEG